MVFFDVGNDKLGISPKKFSRTLEDDYGVITMPSSSTRSVFLYFT